MGATLPAHSTGLMHLPRENTEGRKNWGALGGISLASSVLVGPPQHPSHRTYLLGGVQPPYSAWGCSG